MPLDISRLPTPARGRLRRTLRLSCYEGVAAEVVGSCAGGTMLTAWALYVRASPLVLGLIVALPQLSQLIQIPAAWITSRAGSRRTALWTIALSRQSHLLLCALPWIPEGAPRQAVLVAIATLSTALSVAGNNAWVTWMGRLVPRHLRGRYFGTRTAIITLANAVSALGAGAFLDLARRRELEGPGLSLLALVAAAAGLASTVLMRRQVARRERWAPGRLLAHLAAPLRHTRGRHMLAYQAAWNAAVGLASSFFTVFMLSGLRMTYVEVAVYGVTTSAFKVWFAPHWGRTIDRAGHWPVLVLCSFVIALLPFLWLFTSPGWLWPVAVDAMLTGIFWGGQTQASFQLPLAAAPPRHLAWHVALFSAVAGAAFGLATAAGGSLVTHWPATFSAGGHTLSSYQVLFALSGVCRLGVAVASLRFVESRGARLHEALPNPIRPVVAGLFG